MYCRQKNSHHDNMMCSAVGKLFEGVKGVKIAAVNCDEKDEDGINKVGWTLLPEDYHL